MRRDKTVVAIVAAMAAVVLFRRYIVAGLFSLVAMTYVRVAPRLVRADNTDARRALPQYFPRAEGPAVRNVYVWTEPGFTDASQFIAFETTDSTIVSAYLATREGHSLARDTSDAQYRSAFPPWFNPPRPAEGEYYRDPEGRLHLWTTADHRRVWEYRFSF